MRLLRPLFSHSTRTLHTLILCAIITFACTVQETNAQKHCDPTVLVDYDVQEGYRARGRISQGTDRCEGFFRQPLSSTAFEFVSFFNRFSSFDTKIHNHLLIEWPAYSGARIHVQALGIKRGRLYRMDTIRPGDAQRFTWDMDVLSGFDINHNDLDLRAWVYENIESDSTKLHIPLAIGPNRTNNVSKTYRLTFFTRIPIREVYFSVSTLEGDIMLPRKALEWGFYPEAESIDIAFDIRDLKKEGTYRIELSIEEKGTINVYSADFWFYHGARTSRDE